MEVEALPSMDELLGQHVDLQKVRKIGEGTFGEAYKVRSALGTANAVTMAWQYMDVILPSQEGSAASETCGNLEMAPMQGGKVVFKIVPMEGATLVNGEPQKVAEEILAETEITLTLSQMRGAPGEAVPQRLAHFKISL